MAQFASFTLKPKVAVALSGGGDSMALVFFLKEWVEEQEGSLTTLTVDHRLRPESTIEAKQVAGWMKKAGIKHHILADPASSPTSNVQEYARELRYRLMTEWCQKHRVSFLCTGHTYDDQVETFLLRLQRGSGVDGLAAMPASTQRNGIHILRPIMGFRRDELRNYLKSQNLPWLEDPSNEKDYDRNAVRKLLRVRANADLSKRFFDTALAMGRARAALEQETNDAFSECADIQPEGYGMLKTKEYNTLPEEIALRLLRNMLSALGGNATTPRFEKLHSLHCSIRDGLLQKPRTLWGCTLVPHENSSIVILREYTRISEHTSLLFDKPVLWDNRFKIVCQNQRSRHHYFLSPLSPKDWRALKKEQPALKNPFRPQAILHTLPVLKALSPEGIETILGIPHINWYREKTLRECIYFEFSPAFSLTAAPFNYWNA